MTSRVSDARSTDAGADHVTRGGRRETGRQALQRPLVATWWPALVVVTCGVVLTVLGASHPQLSVVDQLLRLLVGLVFTGIGALVLARLPRNRLGWVLYAIGLCQASVVGSAYAAMAELRNLPGGQVGAWLGAWPWFPSLVLLGTFVLLLFPDGDLASPWRRRTAVVSAAALVLGTGTLMTGFTMVADIPIGATPEAIPRSLLPVLGVALLLGVVAVGASIVSIVRRYRRSHGLERTQLKWFAFGGSITALGVFTTSGPDAGTVQTTVSVVTLMALPIAISVAVFRYRLFEIDRLVSRTVTYGVVTAILAGVYALGVVGLGGIARTATGSRSDLVVAASTLVVAALFGPVRGRVQAVVDHRFNRAGYDAHRTVADFGQQLRDEVDLEAVAGALTDAAQRTLAPAHVAIWLPTSRNGPVTAPRHGVAIHPTEETAR